MKELDSFKQLLVSEDNNIAKLAQKGRQSIKKLQSNTNIT